MDTAAELLAHARAFASSGEDLYALLGIENNTTTTPTSAADIHRAWRKRSLKYHPDKAGDAFDPEKWQLFERARDVLSDAAAREAYDTQRSAALLREQAKSAMDEKRRRMVEDLEAREKAGSLARSGGQAMGGAGNSSNSNENNNNMMSEQERKKMAEAGRRRVEERQRLMREAEERERQRAADKEEADLRREADLERRIGEIQARKAAKKAADKMSNDNKDKQKQHQQGDVDVEMHDDDDGDRTTKTAESAPAATTIRPEVLEAQEKAKRLSAEAAAIPRVRGDFSHTYARLKAAQAAKEAKQLLLNPSGADVREGVSAA